MKNRSMKIMRLIVVFAAMISMLACQFLLPEATPEPAQITEPPATEEPATEAPPTEAPTTEAPTATPSVEPPPSPDEIEIPDDIHTSGFSKLYKIIPIKLPEAFYESGYTLPVDLNTLYNVEAFPLNPNQEFKLSEQGFFATPGSWLEYFQLYEAARYSDTPVFITTDSIYHVYHLLFDKLLRDLERESLAPTLEELTNALVQAAQVQAEATQGTPIADSARRVWGYFVVAQQLLSETPPPIPGALAEEVNAELALIRAHDGIQMSPLLTLPEAFDEGLFCDPDATPEQADKFYCEDYSQYVPRGHYTRDEQLKRYFRAMMWYGRINLRLKQPRETSMALLITRLIRQTEVNGRPAAELWASIYDPTVFLVGKSDDLSFHEYGPLMDEIYGYPAPLDKLADNGYLAAFINTARQLPPPQINSMWVYIWEDKDEVTQGFRFMGQRFVLDSYIFEQLTHREVDRRMLPKGLDVFAAMGNEEAYRILDEMGETAYTNYDAQLEKVQEEISGLELDSWTQNLYWNWLYALQAIAAPKDAAYPAFMQTQAWARKDLQTALGSWTELKHDTILYAKQVMAELGGGAPEELPIHGYVEPNPEAYARLLALTRMTREGLAERALLSEKTDNHLTELENQLMFFQSMAERELSGGKISEEEYERLKFYGGWLEMMTLAAADTPEDSWSNQFSEDEQAAIIADVATDPTGYVLEEATGRISELFAVVPDGRGNLQLAKGGIYAYYEFSWPISDRLTNEQWRQMLAEDAQPPQPAWTEAFIVP